jgi:hypothetical protein
MSNLKNLLKKASLMGRESILSVDYGLSDGVVEVEDLLASAHDLQKMREGGATDEEVSLQLLRVFSSLMGDKPRMRGVFSPSEVCDEDNWCGRKFYFDLLRVPYDAGFTKPAESDNALRRLFDLGTMVHWYLQASLLRSGHLLSVETRVTSDEFLVNGSTDGVVMYQGEKMLLEIKTMNTFQFGKLTAPVEKQVRQASIYAHFHGLDKILMLYYDKNNSELKEFVADVDMEFVDRFKALSKRVQLLVAKNRRRKGEELENHVLENRVCRSATCARAAKCPYTTTCFKLG